ncbi:hypothetical protein [Calothrix sp. PCC 7507]|uniref:hypothetical protein n=1 Tax=Calothrix sp. PCC 7507 TaxID=99598 RepID=UPI00118192A3
MDARKASELHCESFIGQQSVIILRESSSSKTYVNGRRIKTARVLKRLRQFDESW